MRSTRNPSRKKKKRKIVVQSLKIVVLLLRMSLRWMPLGKRSDLFFFFFSFFDVYSFRWQSTTKEMVICQRGLSSTMCSFKFNRSGNQNVKSYTLQFHHDYDPLYLALRAINLHRQWCWRWRKQYVSAGDTTNSFQQDDEIPLVVWCFNISQTQITSWKNKQLTIQHCDEWIKVFIKK